MSAHEPGDTLIEALRRANPVPAAEAEGRRALPSAHALFAEIVAQPPRRVGGRARRRALIVLIAIVVLALLVAGFMVVRRDRAKEPLTTACYRGTSLDSRRVIVAGSDDPARTCASLWRDGTFAKNRTVRRFDVCVLASGVPAAFPGESGSVCGQLHLPEFKSGPGHVGDFTNEANARVMDACIGADAAERIVKEELAKFGLDDWVVARDLRPFGGATRCASLAFDPDARRITLIPTIDVHADQTSTTG